MTNVIAWPRHKRQIFESLGGCSVCCTWEGEVPRDCPGVEMTDEQRAGVLAGELDYLRKDGWTTVTYSQRLKNRMLCEEP